MGPVHGPEYEEIEAGEVKLQLYQILNRKFYAYSICTLKYKNVIFKLKIEFDYQIHT